MAVELADLKRLPDFYGALIDEFDLSDDQRRRLRYLLEVPNLVIGGVHRQIALGVYKSRAEAEAGLRFTLDDASREIERMLTAYQFSRLKPLMEHAPARSYLIGVSATISVAGGNLAIEEYVRLLRVVKQEFAKEKIHPVIGWVATLADQREVYVYLEKRKSAFLAIVEQAKSFLNDMQMAALLKFERVQMDRAFDVWKESRFRFPGERR